MRLRRDAQEVHKLRKEVNELRRSQSELSQLRQENARLRERSAVVSSRAASEPDPEVEARKEEDKRQGIAKLNGLKQWMLALRKGAEANNNAMPAGFSQAAAYFDPNSDHKLDLEQFEIVNRVAFNELTQPERTIVIREKQAWQTWNGGWAKSYGFADGHSEIHFTRVPSFGGPEVHFEAWERERGVKP